MHFTTLQTIWWGASWFSSLTAKNYEEKKDTPAKKWKKPQKIYIRTALVSRQKNLAYIPLGNYKQAWQPFLNFQKNKTESHHAMTTIVYVLHFVVYWSDTCGKISEAFWDLPSPPSVSLSTPPRKMWWFQFEVSTSWQTRTTSYVGSFLGCDNMCATK